MAWNQALSSLLFPYKRSNFSARLAHPEKCNQKNLRLLDIL